MREGKTLTRTMSIETRQHELFNIDLGEGAPRAALVAGLIVTAVWCFLMWLILGAPGKGTFTLFVLPPALLTVYGWRESENNPRRRRVTDWALAIRFVIRGCRPIVALGRRAVGHSRGLLDRIGDRFAGGDLRALVMPWRVNSPTHAARKHARMNADGVTYGGRVHITGTQAAERLMQRAAAKRRKRTRTKTRAMTAQGERA